MSKILLLLLIPLLSGTFVLKEDYEQRIDELEQRILALENVEDELLNYNNTIEKYLESEDMMLSMTVVVENGVITEYYACGDYCEDLDYTQKEVLYESMLEQFEFELQQLFDYWYNTIEEWY